MNASRRATLVIVVLTLSVTVLGQGTRVPGESGRPVVVRGRVVSQETGDAVRGARLTVVTSTGGGATVLTDARGGFDLQMPQNMPASLRVAKAGFVTSVVSAPQSTDRASARPFEIALVQAGAISGRVRDGTGNPAQGIRVTVRPDGAPPAQTGGTAETDDRGEYRIGGLPPGRYVVRVSGGSLSLGLQMPEAIIKGDLAFRQQIQYLTDQALGGSDRTVDVRSGEVVSLDHDGVSGDRVLGMVFERQGGGPPAGPDVARVIAVPRTQSSGGVVAGIVLDSYGDPVEGAAVELRSLQPDAGRKMVSAGVSRRQTDDTGRFRLFGVADGTYFLAALPAVDVSSATTQPRSAPAVLSPDGLVSYTGLHQPAQASSPFAPVYYPGGASLTSAVTLTVRNGQELSGLSLTLDLVPTLTVRGVVLDASGRAGLSGSVSLAANLPTGAVGLTGPEGRIREDGGFELSGVAPGDYILQAVGKGSSGERELGLATLSVTGTAPGLAFVATSTGSRVSGRLYVDGETRLDPRIGMGVAPADPAYSMVTSVFTGGFVGPDGTFELAGLQGPGRLVLEGAPDGWWLRSVRLDGRDVTDQPVTFGVRDYSSVEAVVATDGGGVQGRVLTDGPPDSGHGVVVFPVDSARWFYRSRHLRLGTTGPGGSFSITGLPPGEYWVAAMRTNIREGVYSAWQDADLLGRLLPVAQRVRLGPAERRDLVLRPAAGVP